jgi:hypothetical protein
MQVDFRGTTRRYITEDENHRYENLKSQRLRLRLQMEHNPNWVSERKMRVENTRIKADL